ncbi:MAG: ferritin-like domain-containing protein [Candidatus Eremiobacteraeota bacterium]|nr:ferritin-like domain-containing protein [Candidatus Eremiobacteraeota bacterium]
MRIGSDEHKTLFCRWFIDTHRRYAPEDLPWPELDQASLDRLRAVPIWSSALAVEKRAGKLVTGFASTQSDPLLREAIALQGVEEDRHGRILATMLDRYGLTVEEEQLPYDTSERCFIEFGYKECLDAFMGYGAFRLARDAQFLPEPFMSIFVDFMHEETRHIIFFVNWISYQRAQRGEPLVKQAFDTVTGYLKAFRVLTSTVQGANGDSGFMGGGDAFGDMSVANFLRTCVRENDLQMGQFNSGLLRPWVIPALARTALGVIHAADRVHYVAHETKNGATTSG